MRRRNRRWLLHSLVIDGSSIDSQDKHDLCCHVLGAEQAILNSEKRPIILMDKAHVLSGWWAARLIGTDPIPPVSVTATVLDGREIRRVSPLAVGKFGGLFERSISAPGTRITQ